MADKYELDLKRYAKQSRENNLKKQYRRENAKSVFNILSIVLIVFILAIFLRTIATGGTSFSMRLPTFTGFLTTMSDVEPIVLPFINVEALTLGTDWGIFNFLLSIFEFIISLINVVFFFVNGIASVITYLIYFLQWLFLV